MDAIHHLTVLQTRPEGGDYYSILFSKPHNYSFLPGECFDLQFIEKEFTQGRIFSFSSSPTEEHLMVTYKRGVSEYKKRLEQIKPGMDMRLKAFGVQYTFQFDKPLVFIAGGIGMAVFRSAIKYAIDSALQPHITLIYTNRDQFFPYQQDLKEWKNVIPLDIHYRETKKDGRLTEDFLQELGIGQEKKSLFYLAGPPLMIDATTDLLLTLGIQESQMNTDSFDGYSDSE